MQAPALDAFDLNDYPILDNHPNFAEAKAAEGLLDEFKSRTI
jgi:hypothetical protein